MKWNELSMAQKSKLMQLYIRDGVTSLDAMTKHFNQYANGGPKKTFSEWKQAMAQKYPWLELDSQKAGYDYNRYYEDNYDDAWARVSESEARHFTDKYKLPNHPTFSNESIYSQGPRIGGTWTKNGNFIPSVINVQQHPNIYKKNRPYSEAEIYEGKKAISEPVNLKNMMDNNPDYGNRHIDTTMLRQLDNYLIGQEMPLPQRQAIIFSSQQEGNTVDAHGNGAYGLVGWRDDRATPIIGKGIDEQAEYLYNTLMRYSPVHWSDGGKGSGFKSGREAQQAFLDAITAEEAVRALNQGYIKPPRSERLYRTKNISKIFNSKQ